MDSAKATIGSIAIPRDDGGIAQAIQDLDAKIAAWAAAMANAQSHLGALLTAVSQQTPADSQAAVVERAATPAVAAAPSPAPAAAETAQPILPLAKAAPVAPAAPPSVTAAAAPPRAVKAEPAPAAPETKSAADDGIMARLRRLGRKGESKAGEAPAGKEPTPSEPVASTAAGSHLAAGDRKTPELSEDEALLAQLDPKTAKAIRIRRRLGGNKSVRELLDEMQKGR